MKCYLCGKDNLTIIAKKLRTGEGTVWYCERCKLGQLGQKKHDQQRFYDQEYRKKFGPDVTRPSQYDEIFDAYVNYQDTRIGMLKPHIGKTSRLLEVGCSTGHFLYHIKNYVREAIGVDYDSGAAEFAHKKTGCRTYGCALSDSPLEPGTFDVVCAIQTLEHVDDPLQFVDVLKKYLKPEGLLYIEVPNLNDPLLSLYDNPHYRQFFFHEAHSFYYTPESFMELMKRSGVNGTIRFIQDYNIMNHLHWMFLNRPQTSCHEGLGKASLPISGTVSEKTRIELDSFAERVDKEYKSILSSYGYTDNMAFIGRVKKG